MFHGFTFYFYPPKKVNRVNGIRSNISAKHGAQIASKLTDSVTHILVGKNCDNNDFWGLVENYKCVIARSEWCSDSIEHGKLLDLAKYRIDQSPTAHRENAFAVSRRKKNRDYDKKQVVLDMLSELMHARRNNSEEYSAKAYEKAIKVIEQFNKPIVTGNELTNLLSLRMIKIINQVCKGRLLPTISTPKQNSRQQVIDLFCTVFGVGPHNARKLYEQGYRTLNDIYKVLDTNAKVSIEHHGEFVERMSRTEVTKHFEKVIECAHKIDKKLELHCMGSYRRGSPDCGDIDIIVTREDADMATLNKILEQLIEEMFHANFATHTFKRGSDRWLGATQVIQRYRRMDILIVPSEEMGAAVLYYTGSGEFNKMMRYIAKQAGMRLNHNGLFKGTKLLESKDERKIFDILGLKYVDPSERKGQAVIQQ